VSKFEMSKGDVAGSGMILTAAVVIEGSLYL
jgi:hypothetical protein